MHVAYRLQGFPKLSESFIFHEISELASRGHTVSVFADWLPDSERTHPDGLGPRVTVDYVEPIEFSSDLFHRGTVHPIIRKRMRHTVRDGVVKAGRVGQFIDFLRTQSDLPSVIHGHFATELQHEARVAADVLDVPQSVTAHAYDIFQYGARETAKSVLNNADCCITVSEYNRSYLQEELGVTSPISVVPAGFKQSVFDTHKQHTQRESNVLTVSRLVEKKGLDDALRVVRELLDRGVEFTYRIVGRGPERERLVELAQQLNIAEHVAFLGSVSDAELRTEFERASVFLLPCKVAANGDRDAMPVVLKEAMSMRLPCVSTTTSAVPELIDHGRTGLLVEPGTVGQMAIEVERLLADPSHRKRIAERAYQSVQSYQISSVVDGLEAEFQMISERNPKLSQSNGTGTKE